MLLKNTMKKLTGSFRYTQWDPWLIISQIISIQCTLYITLGLILALFGYVFGDSLTLDHIFEYHVSVQLIFTIIFTSTTFSGDPS